MILEEVRLCEFTVILFTTSFLNSIFFFANKTVLIETTKNADRWNNFNIYKNGNEILEEKSLK